jgi:outer membrane receptor protein involved in Fe transport
LKEFAKDKDITATLSYAYFSDKLAVIGTQGKGNMVDKSINRLDFVVKSSLTKNLKLGVSYKNILDPTYKRILEQSKVSGSTTQDVLVSSYKVGSNFKLSLEYKF